MSRKSRRLSGHELLPGDIRAAARDAYDECRAHPEKLRTACLQGISYYERLARRKFEGIITFSTQNNRITVVALRLCSLNRRGNEKVACEAGVFNMKHQIRRRIDGDV